MWADTVKRKAIGDFWTSREVFHCIVTKTADNFFYFCQSQFGNEVSLNTFWGPECEVISMFPCHIVLFVEMKFFARFGSKMDFAHILFVAKSLYKIHGGQVRNYAIIGSDDGLSPESMLAYYQFNPWEHISVKFDWQYYNFHSGKWIWKCLQNGGRIVPSQCVI